MNDEQLWQSINMRIVKEIYDKRFKIHERLLLSFRDSRIHDYVLLALGIEDTGGNYSASEYGLGEKILRYSSEERVFQLAKKLFDCGNPTQIPDIVFGEDVPYLKISVGSEMAALLKPEECWVCNARTLWAHLLIKHKNVEDANSELRAYHEGMPSEMEYQLWKQEYPLVGSDMIILAVKGTEMALSQGVDPGRVRFLWADALATTAYNEYSH